MHPYLDTTDLPTEEVGYIHEPDLPVCPVCWWASGHEPYCIAEVEVSINDLPPEYQDWLS